MAWERVVLVAPDGGRTAVGCTNHRSGASLRLLVDEHPAVKAAFLAGEQQYRQERTRLVTAGGRVLTHGATLGRPEDWPESAD